MIELGLSVIIFLLILIYYELRDANNRGKELYNNWKEYSNVKYQS